MQYIPVSDEIIKIPKPKNPEVIFSPIKSPEDKKTIIPRIIKVVIEIFV